LSWKGAGKGGADSVRAVPTARPKSSGKRKKNEVPYENLTARYLRTFKLVSSPEKGRELKKHTHTPQRKEGELELKSFQAEMRLLEGQSRPTMTFHHFYVLLSQG